MKKKLDPILEPSTQLVPVTQELPLSSSLEQLSLEQLFELLKITLEIEESELDMLTAFSSTSDSKILH